MRLLAFLLLPLFGCSGSEPTSAADCTGISSAKERDECYLKVLPAVFKADAEAGVRMVENDVSDPVSRDFAWYKVTKEVDPNSNKYCDRIKDRTLADRCRTLVSRPHLHRDLTGSEAVPSGMKNAPDRSKPAIEPPKSGP
jgi:hypothetical protein